MKASIKFRDDERPLVRAKVPIAVLGLPFQSGLAAGGDPRELRFDVSTAFASGPALRLSYRPNDPALPFALTVRAGLGPLGSPARAPFVLAAEFNLLAPDPSSSSSTSSSPAFFLRLKPRLGDFSLSHTLRSPAAAAAAPAPRKVGEPGSVDGGGGHGHAREVKLRVLDYRPPFTFTGSGIAAAGSKSGVGALLSGMRLTTRSVLPLWGKASLRFNWGLRVPPELLADDGKGARGPVSKMPLLVMSKVCIEQSPRAGAADTEACGRAPPAAAALASTDAASDDDAAAFSLVRRQLESLSEDSMLLRRAVEDLRAEVRSNSWPARPAAAATATGRGEGRVAATAVQTQMRPRPQPFHATKPERGAGTAREQAAAPDDVGEELKKALEARLR